MISWATCCSRPSHLSPADRGSAAVDFTLVAPLVVLVAVTIIQLGGWVVAMADAHRVVSAAARSAAQHPGSQPAQRLAARAVLVERLPAAATSPAINATPDRVTVRAGVPLRLLGWESPVRGEVEAHADVEPA